MNKYLKYWPGFVAVFIGCIIVFSMFTAGTSIAAERGYVDFLDVWPTHIFWVTVFLSACSLIAGGIMWTYELNNREDSK
jgi:hypothetical protein